MKIIPFLNFLNFNLTTYLVYKHLNKRSLINEGTTWIIRAQIAFSLYWGIDPIHCVQCVTSKKWVKAFLKRRSLPPQCQMLEMLGQVKPRHQQQLYIDFCLIRKKYTWQKIRKKYNLTKVCLNVFFLNLFESSGF